MSARKLATVWSYADRRRLWRLLVCVAATATCTAWGMNCTALAAENRSSSENPWWQSSAQRHLHVQFSPAWLTEKEVNPAKAIEAIQRNSWYDKERKGFAPPQNLADPDTPLRRSGWSSQPKAQKSAPTNTTTGTGTGRGWFSAFNSLSLNYALIVGLAVLLVLAALSLSYSSLRNWLPGRFRQRGDLKAAKIDLAKVIDLPFEVKPTRHDPLGEAEALMTAGRFDEAIVFLFGYVLLALDQASLIQLQRGKTNRMYLRELKGRLKLRSITELAMLAFEDVFFGRYRLSRDRFFEVWDQLPAFHAQIQLQDTSQTPGKVVSS